MEQENKKKKADEISQVEKMILKNCAKNLRMSKMPGKIFLNLMFCQ